MYVFRMILAINSVTLDTVYSGHLDEIIQNASDVHLAHNNALLHCLYM